MISKALIIKACENWIEDHENEPLVLSYTAVKELYEILTQEKEYKK
jgi:hypothetical protein